MKQNKIIGRNIITSFSYNLADVKVVEAAETIAKENHMSFSELIITLLKQEVRRTYNI